MNITPRSDYADTYSICCGDTLHRPADDSESPWFCYGCGTAYDAVTGEKVAR